MFFSVVASPYGVIGNSNIIIGEVKYQINLIIVHKIVNVAQDNPVGEKNE